MQAAITLAKRNFKPIIFEKQDKLGGTLNLGDQPPHKELMTEFCQTLVREVKDLDIEVKLNTEANPQTLNQKIITALSSLLAPADGSAY